jgi:hypothetical protein
VTAAAKCNRTSRIRIRRDFHLILGIIYLGIPYRYARPKDGQ